MLKIWGREDSVNVQKVMWCVRELDLPHERIDAGRGYGLVGEPWYRAKNPNGLVPTIEEDGFVLWESNAIVKYLCAKHSAGKLSPLDPHAYADADRWMTWQASTLAPAMRELRLSSAAPGTGGTASVAFVNAMANAVHVWNVLNDRLEGREYIMGAAFTMADIVFGAHLHHWISKASGQPAFSHLQGWYARLRRRKHYQPHDHA